MTDWLEVFMQHEAEGFSCSCSRDCDRERQAAYAEILRLSRELVADDDSSQGIAPDYADSAE